MLERDVRLAKVRVLEQLGIDWGTACEHLGELQAGLGDLIHLVDRADQRGRGRKRLGAEVVLGMNVCGDEKQRLRAGELLRHLVYRRTVARAEAGVDDEHGAIADDVADIRHQGDAVVRDDVDVGGDLAEPLDLDDRLRRRLRRQRQHSSDKCQRQDHDSDGRAHGTSCWLFCRRPRDHTLIR